MLMMFLLLIGGAGFVLALWNLYKILTSRGSGSLQWWQWLLVAICSLTWVLAFAWIGSQLGEGSFAVGGGWIIFGIIIGFNILVFVGLVMNTLSRQKTAE